MEETRKPGRDPLRKPALACGALACLGIAMAAFGPKSHPPRTIDPAEVSASIALYFADAPDGSVIASDAATGAVVKRLPPGDGGFVRTTMRNLAHARKRVGHGPEEPFTLDRLENGELLLSDPATGRIILLNAFGHSNSGAFAAFLDEGRTIR